MKNQPLYYKATVLLFLVTLTIFALIQARDFLYPVAIAVLFSGLLYPVVSFLEKKRFPKALAVLTSVILGIVVIGGLVFLLYSQLKVFFDNFEEIREQASRNFDEMKRTLREALGIEAKFDEQWPFSNMNNVLGDVFSATTGTVVKIGLQPVYVFFFLYYREKFYRFLYKVVPNRRHDTLREIVIECGVIAKNYVGGLFIVVLILCVLNSTGLAIIGIKYAILFGILSAVANFIPYFGTLIGGAIPLTYALLIESSSKGLAVALFFVGVQFLENNILTPRITGGHVNINPIITILGIIIGGMIWGIPGMFLSVPALAVAKSISAHINSLKPIAFLLERNGSQSQKKAS